MPFKSLWVRKGAELSITQLKSICRDCSFGSL
jgi:hypothetical protein